MEVAAHVEALRREGALTVSALEVADAGAPVPTCPDWVVRDLARHLGGVHRWATGYVADARTEIWNVDLDVVVGTWPADDDLAAWLGAGCTTLADALEHAPPDLQCWTFLRAPSPLAMWARRQAHETAIHRIDAEVAAGMTPTAVAAAFAADGADELLSCFVPRRSTKLRPETPTSLAVACTDEHAWWLLQMDGEGVRTEAHLDEAPPTDTGAACTVRGAAADVYRALWNRAGIQDLSVDGDRSALEQFGDAVQIRWS
ncbi:MAG TPA: maleylpyruvate isomerase N-terminal domain-containing protein [Acidimicrobiales bacterium]|nr:maleylpyruvate isomerase N-terminal domain-containing protein [Acidimicrobiales bacterium]